MATGTLASQTHINHPLQEQYRSERLCKKPIESCKQPGGLGVAVQHCMHQHTAHGKRSVACDWSGGSGKNATTEHRRKQEAELRLTRAKQREPAINWWASNALWWALLSVLDRHCHPQAESLAMTHFYPHCCHISFVSRKTPVVGTEYSVITCTMKLATVHCNRVYSAAHN